MSKYRLTQDEMETVGEVARVAQAWVFSALSVAEALGYGPGTPVYGELSDMLSKCDGVLSMIEVADRVTVRLP